MGVLALLKEVRSMYEVAWKFARVRYSVMRVQRWWRRCAGYLHVKMMQASKLADQHLLCKQNDGRTLRRPEQERRTANRYLCNCTELQLLIRKEIRIRRRSHLEALACWEEGVLPLHRFNSDIQVDIIKEAFGSDEQGYHVLMRERWRPKLRLEFT